MVLLHAARRAAGAAGVDDAGEVAAAEFGDRKPGCIARNKVIPAMDGDPVGRLAGANFLDPDDVMAIARRENCRNEVPGQLLVGNDDRARTGIAEHVGVIARGVGDVGRDGHAARRHDREIGDQPLGPVLADEGDPVAALEADPLETSREREHLGARFGPADRAPRTVALGPKEGRVAFLIGARQEHLDEAVEMLELARGLHSETATPSLRGSAAPTQRPLTRSMPLPLKVPGGWVPILA